MPASMGFLVIDTTDPQRLAPLRCGLLDVASGRWLEPGNTRELEGFQWRCMADPDGNEFDIDVLPPG